LKPVDIPEEILASLHKSINANMILGDPVKVQGSSFIPIISVTCAYGGTSGNFNSGAGGITIEPVAIIAIHNEKFNFLQIKRKGELECISDILSAVLDVR